PSLLSLFPYTTLFRSLVVIGVYIACAERLRAATVFRAVLLGIILVFGSAWLGLHVVGAAKPFYGVLFVCREIAFVLMLMHFGTLDRKSTRLNSSHGSI